MKFRYLDGLRGWAALAVVFDHFAYAFLPAAIIGVGAIHRGVGERFIHDTPLYLFVDGDFSVCIFFVLSGVVLSAKYFRTKDPSVVVATAAKRYFRLAIPVLTAVLAAFVLLRIGAFHNQVASALTGSTWWQAFWQYPASLHTALYQGAYGALLNQSNGYDPVLWTMQFEFIGSFIVFTTLLVFGGLRNRWIAYAFLAIVFANSYYLAFLLGLVIADCYYNDALGTLRSLLARRYWLPILVVALLVGSYPVGSTAGTMFQNLSLPYYGANLRIIAHVLGAFGVIVAVMSSPLLQRPLQLKWSLFTGRISFSMYLLHFLVLGSYTSYLFVHLRGQVGYREALALAFLPTMLVVLVSAYIFAKHVDEPAIRLSGRIYARFFKPGKVATKSAATTEEEQPGLVIPKESPVA